MQLADLASRLGAVLHGPTEVEVESCAPLETAGVGALSFCLPGPAAERLAASRAGAVLMCAETAALPRGPATAALVVADPRAAFRRALLLLHPPELARPGVDARALVDPTADLGPGSSVGPFVFLGADVTLGAGCVIEPHATVMAGVRLAGGCRVGAGAVLRPGVVLEEGAWVQSGAVIGSDGFSLVAGPDGRPRRVPHLGSVRIGAGSSVGAGSVVARGGLGDTRLGEGTHLDSLVQIGHGARLGDRVAVAAQSGLSGSVTIGNGATLGGQTGVAEGRTIGAGARLAARAGATRDLEAETDYAGFPARPRWSHWRREAAAGQVEQLRRRVAALEHQLAALAQAGMRPDGLAGTEDG